ncbi:MAG: four helix bundle protein [Chloroflexota bacterium]
MKFNDWLQTISPEITNDALWQMTLYRQALFLGELGWYDATKLLSDRRTVRLADQLYRAVGKISSNIAEGYSKASGKDQARFYEYALGSAREARDWYYKGRHILGEEVFLHRSRLLVNIIRQLLNLIPRHRGHKIAEEPTPYEPYPIDQLLQIIPMPTDTKYAIRNTEYDPNT